MQAPSEKGDEKNIFEQYQHLIGWCIRRNLPLITALGLETKDVAQELAIYLIKAISTYDPLRGRTLFSYLCYKLDFGVKDLGAAHKPHGLSGLKKERVAAVSLNALLPNGSQREIPINSDFSQPECYEALNALTPEERRVVLRRMNGEAGARTKAEKALLAAAQRKVSAYYEIESAAYTAAQ